ncbi:hypothetical protein M231_06129 [Tremella mesenterica]|uniref:Alpha-1,6-mannosyltransferase n=1 Tax=Tremella mesenterica TaxID=5217 RepID=A0A4Q1BCM0_TREME|nr:hypothetical protein M231_06129 [Tremella mesenterica]
MKWTKLLPTASRRFFWVSVSLSLVSLPPLWLYLYDGNTTYLSYYLSSPFRIFSSTSSSTYTVPTHIQEHALTFESLKLAHLKSSAYSPTWYPVHLGYAAPLETLNPQIEGYVDRLRQLVDKWFDGIPSRLYLHDSLNRLALHLPPLDHEEKLLKRVVSTDKNGLEGTPQVFRGWEELGWDVFVADDNGMEDMFDWLIQGNGRGSKKFWNVWDSLPKKIMKSDVLRYLVLLQEGGIYTDADTAPRAHPYHWGHGAENRLPPQIASYLSLNNLSFPLHGQSISDPGVSVLIGGEYNAWVENKMGDWRGGEHDIIRSFQLCQWTMMAKPFHPIFIDVVVSIMEMLEQAKEEGKLDGSKISEITGPGPFTDAVFRYLLSAYGITPPNLYEPQTPSLIGDIIILPAYALGFPPEQYDANQFDAKETWNRPVMHSYRGVWKSGG